MQTRWKYCGRLLVLKLWHKTTFINGADRAKNPSGWLTSNDEGLIRKISWKSSINNKTSLSWKILWVNRRTYSLIPTIILAYKSLEIPALKIPRYRKFVLECTYKRKDRFEPKFSCILFSLKVMFISNFKSLGHTWRYREILLSRLTNDRTYRRMN